MADVNYKIVKRIGAVSISPKGWTTELNLISWNGGKPKYDIRSWSSDHEKMGKGITLTVDEAKKLAEMLNELFDRE